MITMFDGGMYTELAKYYDKLGYHIDYNKYAGFADSLNKTYGGGKSGIALDLCCGTGTLCAALDSLGYDVIGVDGSGQMLDEARNRTKQGILYICQDMRELDLYGTVDICTCALDSLNYLTAKKDLERVMSLVHNFLEPGGIFVFDVNTKRKFEEVYAENSYVFDNDDVFCVWQNFYNKKSGICDFLITLFEKGKKDGYSRKDECHREKCYSDKTISSLLMKTGFEIIGKYPDTDTNSVVVGDEMRMFYAAKAIK